MLKYLLKKINQRHFDQKAKLSFENFYAKTLDCQAYTNFCKEIQGQPYPVQNNLSKEEYSDLVNYLKTNKRLKVLDLGCGTGEFIKLYFDDHDMYGVDLAFDLPKYNIKKSHYEGFNFIPNFYDHIISVDSLYMISHLKKLISKLYDSIAIGGTLEVHYTILSPLKENELYKIIKSYFATTQVTDYTHQDNHLWRAAHTYLNQNKTLFQSKQCQSLYRTKLMEVEKNIQLRGKMKRIHIRAIK